MKNKQEESKLRESKNGHEAFPLLPEPLVGVGSLLPFGSAALGALFAFLLQSKYPKLPYLYLHGWDTGPGKHHGRSGKGEEGTGVGDEAAIA